MEVCDQIASVISSAVGTLPAEPIGTISNGQCVVGWANHNVEVEVVGGSPASYCQQVAALPIANSAAFANDVSMDGSLGSAFGLNSLFLAAPSMGGSQVCSVAVGAGNQAMVYDTGQQAFGATFCTLLGSGGG